MEIEYEKLGHYYMILYSLQEILQNHMTIKNICCACIHFIYSIVKYILILQGIARMF